MCLARVQHLAKMRHNLPGKELELPLCLIPRHKALVKEPAKPFQLSPTAVERLQRGDFGTDLLRRARQGVFDPAEPFDCQFLERQRGIGIQWIFAVVFRGAKRLPKAKAAKVVREPTVIGVGKKCDGFCLRLAKMHGAEGTNAFAQPERAASVPRNLLIDMAEPLEIGRVRDENPGHNAGASRVANRILTHRKRLEERRMRLLVRLRNDAKYPS